ncbi:hypothetical protein ACOSQ3_016956 [Xanthoceras sorbifolium]
MIPQTRADLIGGLTAQPCFTTFNGNLARDLRKSGDRVWNKTSALLVHAQLHLNVAFWNVFFRYSLVPRQHRTTVTPDVAKFLFNARHQLSLDIGQIIF